MKATPTKTGVTLKLSDKEALDLAAFIGQLTGQHGLNWYDALADALERKTITVVPDEYGDMTRETYVWCSVQTKESGSDAMAADLIHEITVRQLQLFPGHYRNVA